jgi:spermidine synthase
VGFERDLGLQNSSRILCAGILLLPPTVLMGASLPVLVHACAGRAHRERHVLSFMYAANTAGAVGGAFLSGFAFLPLLGISRSVIVAALLNAGAAVLTVCVRGKLPGLEREEPQWNPVEPTRRREVPASPAAAADRPLARLLILLSAFLSGCTALGLELLWNRTLLLSVGSTTQALALMLSTFLGGIAIGAFLYGRASRRLPQPSLTAGLFQMGIAVSSLLLLHAAVRLPFVYLALWEGLHESALGLVLLRLLPAVLLMLPPTLLMGASLPALVDAHARIAPTRGHDDGEASSVGHVFAANTLGAIVGALFVGLVALPELGVTRGTAWVACIGFAGAAAALLSARMVSVPRSTLVLAALPATAGILLLLLPAWDPRVMARGIPYLAGSLLPYREQRRLDRYLESVRVVHYAEGAESSVLVYDFGEGTDRAFVVNGRHEATTAAGDMRNQLLLGHLPALLHRGPLRSGLVIALGSGMTAGSLALHAESVTVVELEAQVVNAAATFSAWNNDVVHDPRVRIHIDDGRHFLLTTDEIFDVITVDPIHPMVSGSEALYSLENYRLLEARLAPSGIAAQWLPLYQMGREDLRTIVRTFQAAFPDAQVWFNGQDAILIGGCGETLRSAREIRDDLARPEISRSLARVGLHRLGTFLAGFVLGPEDLTGFVEGAPLSLDDRPRLEFSLPWRAYEDTVDANLLELFRFSRRPPPISLEGLDAEELRSIDAANSAVALSRIALALRFVRHEDAMRDLFERALALDPDEPIARGALRR